MIILGHNFGSENNSHLRPQRPRPCWSAPEAHGKQWGSCQCQKLVQHRNSQEISGRKKRCNTRLLILMCRPILNRSLYRDLFQWLLLINWAVVICYRHISLQLHWTTSSFNKSIVFHYFSNTKTSISLIVKLWFPVKNVLPFWPVGHWYVWFRFTVQLYDEFGELGI